MVALAARRAALLVAAMCGLILLNLATFLAAYPQVSNVEGACCQNGTIAKDFSAYYVGAYRMLNDPSQVYTKGFIPDGEIHVYPVQEQYKYLPSFLLLISPLLLLSYQQAIIAFDLVQLLLLPLVGLLVYLLTRDKGPWATLVVAALALLMPWPAPGWGASVPYFWQWKEGQAKVLETFLLLLSFYFGRRGKPAPSGALLGLSFYDPRFAFIAIPFFVACNRRRVRTASASLAAALFVTNLPLLFSGMAGGFVSMVLSTGISSVFYPYALIPLLTVISITVIHSEDVLAALGRPSQDRPPYVNEKV
jgi:hypothetical protein